MPASLIIPIAAAVSSKEIPIELATGATYFNASPMSPTSALVSAAARANTSATCPASLASKPNPLKAVAVFSEARATSPPDTAAKSKRPGIAFMISCALNPAEAKFSIPAADSFALKAVFAPRSIACCFICSNVSPVAPDIAFTRLICASKSPPTLAAATPTPIRGVVIYFVIAAPVPCITLPTAVVILFEFFSKVLTASCASLKVFTNPLSVAFNKASTENCSMILLLSSRVSFS